MSFIWNKHIKPSLKFFGVHKGVSFIKNAYERAYLSKKTPEEIFTNIYQSNAWNGTESVSGQGSDRVETEELIRKLPEFLARHNIKTMIDLPCGDYNWMQYLRYDFDQYIGVDIVEDLVKENNIKFGNATRKFVVKDCLCDDIETADTVMCRDLLIHFSNQDVQKFLANIRRSHIKYLLTTHFIDEKNIDISTGQWRPINLCESPFNLPQPIDMIFEKTKMYDGKYSQTKVMALWRIKDI